MKGLPAWGAGNLSQAYLALPRVAGWAPWRGWGLSNEEFKVRKAEGLRLWPGEKPVTKVGEIFLCVYPFLPVISRDNAWKAVTELCSGNGLWPDRRPGTLLMV